MIEHPMLDDLEATQYELHWNADTLRGVYLEQVRGYGVKRWAIRRGGDCLGKTPSDAGYFFFISELQPSSRDEDYYREYRWESAEVAYKFWLDNRLCIAVTHRDYLAFMEVMK